MRLAAHISQDPHMLQAFRADKDIHTFTATLAYEIPESAVDKKFQRDPLKRVGFGNKTHYGNCCPVIRSY
jgi:DNA polymerase-1